MNVVKVITPLVHFLHFPESIVGELFNSKDHFPDPHPMSSLFDSHLHEFQFISTSIAHFFYDFCLPFFALLAILHVWTLCMFPQVIQVRLLCPKKFFLTLTPYFEVTQLEFA